MEKKHGKWYAMVIVSFVAIVAAGWYNMHQEAEDLVNDSLFYKITYILNEGEATIWPVPGDKIVDWTDEEIFNNIDYSIQGCKWQNGPNRTGISVMKVGRYTLKMERIPSTYTKPGRWERGS